MNEEIIITPQMILELEKEGLVTRTFRRLDADRQQSVLFGIIDEAIESGPADFNITGAARRAGVSVGSMYTYFPQREAALAFAVRVCVHFVTTSFEEYLPMLAALPLREGLVAYLGGGVEWGQVYGRLLRLFARAAYQGDAALQETLVRPVADCLRKIVAAMLEAAVERGELRPDVDFDAAVRLVHALTIIAGDAQLIPYLNVYWQIIDDETSLEHITGAMVDFILRGIGV